jgi:hypothetical protein
MTTNSLAFIGTAEGVCCIFYQLDTVFFRNRVQLV